MPAKKKVELAKKVTMFKALDGSTYDTADEAVEESRRCMLSDCFPDVDIDAEDLDKWISIIDKDKLLELWIGEENND